MSLLANRKYFHTGFQYDVGISAQIFNLDAAVSLGFQLICLFILSILLLFLELVFQAELEAPKPSY